MPDKWFTENLQEKASKASILALLREKKRVWNSHHRKEQETSEAWTDRIILSEEALIKLARADRREFFCLKEARNRRNTVCISRLSNEFAAEKDRRLPKTHLISGSLRMMSAKSLNPGKPLCIVFPSRSKHAHSVGENMVENGLAVNAAATICPHREIRIHAAFHRVLQP